VVYPRVAGLDIHKKLIVACRIILGTGAQVQREVRSFGATTAAIEELSDWLAEGDVTHVAMEATGVHWKPLFNLLEHRFTLVLANAQHIKAVPGRKTDVKDSEWIADLLRHGLIKGSFVPDRAQRELRELTRYRTSLVRERAAVANRIQKILEGANIKLGDVATDVLGQSGRAILEDLVAGESDPAILAGNARGQMKSKRWALQEALRRGSVGPHQRFLLEQQLGHIDCLEWLIARVDAEVSTRLNSDADPSPEMLDTDGAPVSGTQAVARLDTIPGVGSRIAEVVVAEIGRDMSRFLTADHLASWAGLVPGHHESAGKRFSGRTRKGSPALRVALVEAARAAARTHTYPGCAVPALGSPTRRQASGGRCCTLDSRDRLPPAPRRRRVRRSRTDLFRSARQNACYSTTASASAELGRSRGGAASRQHVSSYFIPLQYLTRHWTTNGPRQSEGLPV
jgi:transposase